MSQAVLAIEEPDFPSAIDLLYLISLNGVSLPPLMIIITLVQLSLRVDTFEVNTLFKRPNAIKFSYNRVLEYIIICKMCSYHSGSSSSIFIINIKKRNPLLLLLMIYQSSVPFSFTQNSYLGYYMQKRHN